MNKHRQSSHDISRMYCKYLVNIPESEWQKAKIIREQPANPASHVKIIQNGVVTYDSRVVS